MEPWHSLGLALLGCPPPNVFKGSDYPALAEDGPCSLLTGVWDATASPTLALVGRRRQPPEKRAQVGRMWARGHALSRSLHEGSECFWKCLGAGLSSSANSNASQLGPYISQSSGPTLSEAESRVGPSPWAPALLLKEAGWHRGEGVNSASLSLGARSWVWWGAHWAGKAVGSSTSCLTSYL